MGKLAVGRLADVPVTLYTMGISHPGWSARLMLDHKGVDANVVDLRAGLHPLLLWLRGYRSGTVPALAVDGRRVEGSLAIARELERLVPEPSLYPSDPVRRAAVEEAERWGEQELQNLPRQIGRYAIAHDTELRTWFNREHARMPLPRVAATLSMPVALAMAARSGGNEAGARSALAKLPAALDHVDALLADGTLGGEQLSAADCQIAPSVRLTGANAGLAALVAGRPCDAWSRRLLPDYPDFPRSRALDALTAA